MSWVRWKLVLVLLTFFCTVQHIGDCKIVFFLVQARCHVKQPRITKIFSESFPVYVTWVLEKVLPNRKLNYGLHNLFLEVLTLHSNQLHLFILKTFPHTLFFNRPSQQHKMLFLTCKTQSRVIHKPKTFQVAG